MADGLFYPKSEAEVRKLVLAAKLLEHDLRKADAQKAWDYYIGAGKIHTEQAMRLRFGGDTTKYHVVPVDLVETMVTERAMLYKAEPERKLVDEKGQPLNDDQQGIAGEMWEQAMMGSVMQEAEALALLQRTILLKPCWKKNEEVPDGRLELQILGAHMVDVVQAEMDPTRAIAALYAISYPDTVYETGVDTADPPFAVSNQAPQNPDALTYVYWDSERHFAFGADGKKIPIPDNSSNVNPYGLFQFQTIRDRLAHDRYWLPISHALVEANETINVTLTDIFHGIPKQLWGQAVAIGPDVPKTIKVGPGEAITLKTREGQQASFGYAQPVNNLIAGIETIMKTLQIVAKMNHNNPSDYVLEGSAASGFALHVRNLPKLEDRARRMPLFRRYEQELFVKMRAVWNVHNERKIDEGARLSIDFAEPELPSDQKEQLDVQDRRLNLGLDNILDLYMRENPDVKTRQDAEAKMADNIATRNRLSKRFGFSFGLVDKTTPPDANTPDATTMKHGQMQPGQGDIQNRPEGGTPKP